MLNLIEGLREFFNEFATIVSNQDEKTRINSFLESLAQFSNLPNGI